MGSNLNDISLQQAKEILGICNVACDELSDGEIIELAICCTQSTVYAVSLIKGYISEPINAFFKPILVYLEACAGNIAKIL